MEICALLDQGKIDPALVIGVPVGFVNVVAAKEMLLEKDVPSLWQGEEKAAAILPPLSAMPSCTWHGMAWNKKEIEQR